jgi:hypothetical protein
VVSALGITWLLDGLELTLAGALGKRRIKSLWGGGRDVVDFFVLEISGKEMKERKGPGLGLPQRFT